MNKRHPLLVVSLVWIFILSCATPVLAKGIMGFQMGDRSPEENDTWLKKGVEHIKAAISEAEQGNSDNSVKYGEAGLAAMKEINSEGWAAKLERSVKSIRHGIRAAKKGNLEKASLKYQNALKKLGVLKFGDMNFTHESFLGIGDRR